MNDPWKDLSDKSVDGVFIRADTGHPLGFFWGRGPGGEYVFLYEAIADIEKSIRFSLIKGVDVIVQKNKVMFSLKNNSNWAMFLLVCNDLMRATSMLSVHQQDVVLTTLVGRLGKWQEFLGRKRKKLSEAEIKGIIGELIFLRDHLGRHFGLGEAVGYWSGPKGAPQDFSVGDSAYEVKCQEGATMPYIRISSEFQLCAQLDQLYLFVVTVARSLPDDREAISLGFLIDSIRSGLLDSDPDSVVQFEDLLMEIGVLNAEEDILDESYHVAGQLMFRVSGEFPRLCESDLPNGIRGLSYSISLNEIEEYEVSRDSFFCE